MTEIPIIGEVIDSERDTTGTEWLTLQLNKAGQRLLNNETENIIVKVADFRQHGAGLLHIDGDGNFRAMPGLPLGIALEEIAWPTEVTLPPGFSAVQFTERLQNSALIRGGLEVSNENPQG